MNKIVDKFYKNKLVENFIVLLCSDGIVSLITMINTVMVISAIGSYENGVLIMVQTFSTMIAAVFCFSSFNGLIAYLPKLIKEKKVYDIKLYIKQSIYLEIVAGIIAFLIGQLIINLVAKIMKWDAIVIILIRFYLITTIVNISGVASAIIRIYDKFKYLSIVNISTAICRILLYSIGFFFIKSLEYFVTIEIIIDLITKIIYLIFMNRVLKEKEISGIMKNKIKFDKEFIKFSLLTNISQTLDVPVTYLGVFIINKYLGFDSLTMYNIIEKIGNIFAKLSKPIQQIIYPQITTWVAENELEKSVKFSKKIFFIINFLGILASIFVLFTHKLWLERLLTYYDNIFIISLILYLMFVSFVNSTQSIHAYFLAFKLAKLNLYILSIVNLIYIFILFILTSKFGIIGVVLARIIQSLGITLVKLIVIIKGRYLITD